MSYHVYFYDEQIRKYLLQFGDLFHGMVVRTGLRGDGTPVDIPIHIVYGTTDRAAAYILAGKDKSDTTSFSLPAMSFSLTGIAYAQNRAKSSATTDRRTYVQVEDNLDAADELEAIRGIRTKTRFMPTPYDITVELAIWAENNDQHLQILEQILMVFNPQLEIQKTDAPWDWTALTRVVLQDITLDTVFPGGEDSTFIGSSIGFLIPIWISGPMREDINKFVSGIRIQIRDGGKVDEPLHNLTIPGLDEDAIPSGSKFDGTPIPPIGAGTTTISGSISGSGATLSTLWNFGASPLSFTVSNADIFLDNCLVASDTPLEIINSSNIELNASLGALVDIRKVINVSAAAPGVDNALIDLSEDELGASTGHIFGSDVDVNS